MTRRPGAIAPGDDRLSAVFAVHLGVQDPARQLNWSNNLQRCGHNGTSSQSGTEEVE